MIICKNCQAQLGDNALFCDQCGSPVVLEDEKPLETMVEADQPIIQPESEQVPASSPVITPSPVPTKKPKNKKLIALSVLFAVLFVVIVAGILTNWFWGPLRGLFFVSYRTARATDITISIHTETDEISSELIFIQYDIDPKKEDVTLLVDLPISKDIIKKPTYIIIDEQTIYASIAGESTSAEMSKKDMRSFFLAYNMLTGREKLDIEELLEEFGLEDVIDADEVEDFLDILSNDCLCNSVWLKENMGFERDGRDYCFEIVPHKFYKAILEVAKESRLITSKEKRALLESMNDLPNETIKVKISTKNGYLHEIVMKSSDAKVTIEYKDINHTTVDQDRIDKLISNNNSSLCQPMDLYCNTLPAPDFYKRKAYTC